jgi:hypothetical protein
MSYARDKTQDGRELIDFAYRVFKGEPMDMVIHKPDGTEIKYQGTPSLDHRIEMLIYLSDRGFGKPVQKLEGEIRAPLSIVHRLPDHDPLAPRAPRPDEERVLDVTALPVRALKGRTS